LIPNLFSFIMKGCWILPNAFLKFYASFP
jgi:hypothetical protein